MHVFKSKKMTNEEEIGLGGSFWCADNVFLGGCLLHNFLSGCLSVF